MLFNDYPFLLGFLPAAILIYRFVDPHPPLRIWTLVALSLVFYGYGNPPFLPLLVLSILINWLAARAFARTKMRWIVTAAIAANLAVLGLFKYANFLAFNLGLVLGRPMPMLDIALPLGISFFTFHHIMYLVDLRKGKAPFYSLSRYALYISFFPQALAGPLVRWSEVMEQFGRKVYAPGWQREFCIGIAFIRRGCSKRSFSAIRSDESSTPSMHGLWRGRCTNGDAWLALGFSFQILFDFAGYSDIAIGLGLLFGVRLPFNFNAPFRSTSIQDFWQRWHITLMVFLRDYLFHPLVNCRILPRRLFQLQYFAAMVLTMSLCGLWHGASWTFVLWGTLHGCALVVHSLWRRYGPRLPSLAGWALTVIFVLADRCDLPRRDGWMPPGTSFRAWPRHLTWSRGGICAPLVIAPLIAFLLPASQDIIALLTRRPRPWLAALAGLGLLAILIELGERNVYGFVYFKF